MLLLTPQHLRLLSEPAGVGFLPLEPDLFLLESLLQKFNLLLKRGFQNIIELLYFGQLGPAVLLAPHLMYIAEQQLVGL